MMPLSHILAPGTLTETEPGLSLCEVYERAEAVQDTNAPKCRACLRIAEAWRESGLRLRRSLIDSGAIRPRMLFGLVFYGTTDLHT